VFSRKFKVTLETKNRIIWLIDNAVFLLHGNLSILQIALIHVLPQYAAGIINVSKPTLWGCHSKWCSLLHLFLRERPLIKRCALIINCSGTVKFVFWSVMGICSFMWNKFSGYIWANDDMKKDFSHCFFIKYKKTNLNCTFSSFQDLIKVTAIKLFCYQLGFPT